MVDTIQITTLVFSCISSVLSILTLLCMFLIYATLREWVPFVGQINEAFKQGMDL